MGPAIAPGGPEEILGTAGMIFHRMPIHAGFHSGQLAAVRRMLGKPGIFKMK